MLAPGNVWVWREVSEAATIKEHGYLCAGNDHIRGEWRCHITFIPSEPHAPADRL